MINTINRQLFIFGIPALLFASIIFIIKSPLFLASSNALTLAISIDLLFIIPIVYYFFIRKTVIPKTTVVPVAVLGLAIGLLFLPQQNQGYLNLFQTWVLPLLEIALMAFTFYKVRNAVRVYKMEKNQTTDFYTTLKNTCAQLFPKKVVTLMATEFAIMYYGFISWRNPVLKSNEYTHHKNSGSQAIFGGILMVVLIETFALHHLLAKWSNVAAWVLTIISIYTALQILGFAKSLSKRPIAITEDFLWLKYGILSETQIKFEAIERLELRTSDIDKSENISTLSPLGELESHNVILHLKEEHTLSGFYGIKKQYHSLAFFIDEPARFKESVEKNV